MLNTTLPFEVEASASNHLAWMSAILGLQRTLMAAQRSAITLIVFGLTLTQVFASFETNVPVRFRILGPHLPRDVGLLMIAAGVGSLALFTWQYLRAVGYLGTDTFAAISLRLRAPLHHLTCATAYAIMFLGGLAFASVFLSS